VNPTGGPAETAAALPQGLAVREATASDNDSLIALELESPLDTALGEETYDRSPDFFACHRHKPDYRVVIAEWDGRAVGVMTGVIHEPLIQGKPRKLMYVQQARVHRAYHGRRVAWALANDLFAWAGSRGAEGPYYLIAPDNKPSLAFVERGGGRWPTDVTLISFEASGAEAAPPPNVGAEHVDNVVGLINATHAGEDFFEPLTAASLAARLGKDKNYRIADIHGIFEDGTLLAVAGLWDKGATTERRHRDRATGVLTRSRSAYVVDWGWAPGREDAFAALLRGLAATVRRLDRSGLMICEPSQGKVPEPGIPAHRSAVALFTPSLAPPDPGSIHGLCVDMLYV
jgi:GNAT superfamily N-acetyltransferase